ncbi:MAG TPA: N-acetyl-gamma-glutamyl-phosphate reductase [Gemmatimonadaceae bacterium]|nr:N-acetyl-gamma-glutamyl-phosphate reductase [Gemmatimonadaceae bacterium]
MHKIPVGVLGASGYAGRELCLLIERHPSLCLEFATANGQRGDTVRIAGKDVTFIATEDAPLANAELVFSSLPHGTSLEWVDRARAAGKRVVDLSADLRPGNGSNGIPYGLTELARQDVAGAELVSNPGCYPTAILLALAPLMEQRLIQPGSTISASAASGVTGAGFTARPDLLFAEISEDFRAYGVGNEHRHLAEMRATLGQYDTDIDLVFTPHLLPVARGILATIVVRLNRDVTSPLDIWAKAYAGERFIELSDTTPSLRDVVRRNVVRISAVAASNVKNPALIITAAIDNLTKGAAGQAVQNANLMLGLEEAMGLPA